MSDNRQTNIHKTIQAVWKMESTRSVAGIARVTRDIGIAEELAQNAAVVALALWLEEGIAERPAALADDSRQATRHRRSAPWPQAGRKSRRNFGV